MELIEQSPLSSSHWEKQMIMALEEDYNSTTDSDTSMESQKTILSEEGDNSSRDSNSSGYFNGISPPRHFLDMQPQLLIITREELEKIKSGDAEAIRLKDYVDWFMSVRAEVDENDVFWPEYYGRWFSTLETEAQADYVHPFHYTQWYVERFDLGESDDEFSDTAVVRAALIERCGQLALEYFNSINKFDDYEYASDVAIRKCDDSYHLNFYGRLRVSPSRPGSPTILFFADVDFEDKVLECCTLDSEEFDDEGVLHPPGTYCAICYDGICCYE